MDDCSTSDLCAHSTQLLGSNADESLVHVVYVAATSLVAGAMGAHIASCLRARMCDVLTSSDIEALLLIRRQRSDWQFCQRQELHSAPEYRHLCMHAEPEKQSRLCLQRKASMTELKTRKA